MGEEELSKYPSLLNPGCEKTQFPAVVSRLPLGRKTALLLEKHRASQFAAGPTR
jgi:hypothetical protein